MDISLSYYFYNLLIINQFISNYTNKLTLSFLIYIHLFNLYYYIILPILEQLFISLFTSYIRFRYLFKILIWIKE